MNGAITGVHLIGGWLPVVVDVAAVTLLIAVVGWSLVPAQRPGARLRWTLIATISAAGGAAVGLLLCWLLSDWLNLFDVSLTSTSRAWVAGALAAIAVAVAGVARSGLKGTRVRRVAATGAVVVALLAGALGVNADFGQYTTLGSLGDAAAAAPLPASVLTEQLAGAPGAEQPSTRAPRPLWRIAMAVGMPRHGLVGSVTIPGTVSHFAARDAYVYLPPAALVRHPAALPVLIMMSGQPGSPSNVISSGQIAAIFDAFAKTHNGLAPIVLVPDQLGAPARNPMCVNGVLGASERYLTVDVPDWIRSHLTVQASPAAWAIGGFSQGGTCSIQLGAGHPELFSAIVDISGQLAPKNGDLAQTMAIGFGSSVAAYRAALPEAVLARNTPYRPGIVAVFGVGQLDSRYGPIAARLAAAAQNAGISATEAISPGTGHDWHTVHWVLEHAMTPIYRQLGLEGPS